jgi:hypothetical protein
LLLHACSIFIPLVNAAFNMSQGKDLQQHQLEETAAAAAASFFFIIFSSFHSDGCDRQLTARQQ